MPFPGRSRAGGGSSQDYVGGGTETTSQFAQYMSRGPYSYRTYNTPYDLSILDSNFEASATDCGSIVRAGYSDGTRVIWGSWLLECFAGDPDSLEDNLVYQWVRKLDNRNNPAASLWTLARTLEDSPWSSTIPSDRGTGDDRLARIFRRYGLARWMDPTSASQGVSLDSLAFPDSSWNRINPWDYVGLFSDSLVSGNHEAVYVPPTIVVTSSSLCQEGFLPDLSDLEAVENWTYEAPDGSCDIVATPLWGTSYYVFEAGSGVDDSTTFALNVDIAMTDRSPDSKARMLVDWIGYDTFFDHALQREALPGQRARPLRRRDLRDWVLLPGGARRPGAHPHAALGGPRHSAARARAGVVQEGGREVRDLNPTSPVRLVFRGSEGLSVR